MNGPAALLIANVHPLLTAAQGDDGNARALRHRARLHGIESSIITVGGSRALPTADVYLIGGAPRSKQPQLVSALRKDGRLATAVAGGAVVFGVNAGFLALGETYTGKDSTTREGACLLDVRFTTGDGIEGPVVTRANAALGLGELSGYESHTGRATLGPGVRPLATLECGVGNGDRPATDGAVAGKVIGTWLHGPVLARNPELADLLLRWAVGGELPPIDPGYADLMRT